MLDLRNAAFGMRERHPEFNLNIRHEDHSGREIPYINTPALLFDGDEEGGTGGPTPHPVELELTPGQARISLSDMIATSVALKSNLDVEILKPSTPWPSGLFPTATSSPSKGSISLPPESESSSLLLPESQIQEQSLPIHVVQAISGLQREVLLLRNELNFELWLSRENVKHIGRLYQNKILSKNAEAERQGLVSLHFSYIKQDCVFIHFSV